MALSLIFLSWQGSRAEDVPVEPISDYLVVRNPFSPQFPKVKPVTDIEAAQTQREESEKAAQLKAEPVVPEEIVPPVLNVTGIIWNTDRPQAIINGKIVSTGDTINEAVIISIQKTEIKIAYKGKTMSIAP